MAENISQDINTEDEKSIKHTRHDRAAAKNVTSDESFDLVNELEQFERELKNDFYENGKCFFIHNN